MDRGRARPRATRSRSALRSPSTSSAAAETLATASASGISAGIASRASSVETSSGGITTIPSSPSGGSKRAASGAPSGVRPADHEAAVDRRRDVVGMALQLGRPRQHLLAASAPARRGGRRRRGRRRSPRRWSRARAPAGSRCAAGRRSRRPGAGSRRRGRRGCRARSRPRARPGRARTPPSPRPPARGGARPPPPSRRSPDRGWPRRRGRGRVGGARSIEHRALDRARSLSQLITAGALPSAVSGSLRPWPVRTQTTDSGFAAPSTVGRPWASRPATEAAEAGSQKTPSLSASQR